MDGLTARGIGAGGLATRGARWALVCAWALGGVKAGIDGQLTPSYLTLPMACVLCLVAVFLLTRREDAPLSAPLAALVAALLIVATALALTVPFEEASIWQLHFASYLLALLLVRGNPLPAAIGAVVHFALMLWWTSANEVPPEALWEILPPPLIAYLVSVLWLFSLRRIVEQERAHRSDAAEHARQAGAELEASRRVELELELVRARTEHVLTRLRDGAVLDDGLRAEIAVVEGEIRDRIRSPRLQHPELNRAIASVRARGASVNVLADDSPDGPRLGERAANEIASVLRSAPDADSIVIAWTEPQRVSIVTQRDGESTRRHVEVDEALPPEG